MGDGTHDIRRLCNRLIEEAMVDTAAEIGELFAELAYTRTAGFDATAMAVADEAGDVWYMYHYYCYYRYYCYNHY